MSKMLAGTGTDQAGMSGQIITDVAPGKAPGVSSQVPTSGSIEGGNAPATYGFYDKRTGEYHTGVFKTHREAMNYALCWGWELDCVIPEGWK